MGEDANTFAIRRAVLGRHPVILLSTAEYEAIKAAHTGLREVLDLEEKFDVVIENFYSLEKELVLQTLQHQIWPNFKYTDFQLSRTAINRHLINLLSACRLYQDAKYNHVAAASSEHDAADKIKVLTSKIYDHSLSFRLMEALRNHAQHYAFAAASVRYHAEWLHRAASNLTTASKLSRFGISFQCSVSELKENQAFKRTILEEMEKLPEIPDLKLMVREYIDGLRAIHLESRNFLGDEAAKYEKLIADTVTKYKEADSDKSDTAIAVVQLALKQQYRIQFHLMPEFATYRKKFLSKNSLSGKYAEMYVSTEVIG